MTEAGEELLDDRPGVGFGEDPREEIAQRAAAAGALGEWHPGHRHENVPQDGRVRSDGL